MTTGAATYLLDAVRLAGLRAELGVQTWPAVLDESGLARTAPAGVDHGADALPDWLVEGLRVLGHPLCHIEIRTVDDASGCVRRTCIAARPRRVVEATIVGEGIVAEGIVAAGIGEQGEGGAVIGFRDLGAPAVFLRDGPALLAAVVRGAFGDADVPRFGSITAPRDHVLDILRQTTGLGAAAVRETVADGLRRLDVDTSDARVAAAFATASRRSEVVAYAAEGVVTEGMVTEGVVPYRSPGAIGVFETTGGRIVASAAAAADGRMWTTLSPGTGHRIEQAVTLLLEPLGRLLPAGAGNHR